MRQKGIYYLYKNGDRRNCYEVNELMIKVYPREDLILKVTYDFIKDITMIKLKRGVIKWPDRNLKSNTRPR